MMLTQTIDVPESRKIQFEVPDSIPAGQITMVVYFPTDTSSAGKTAVKRQSLKAEVMADAARKYEERFKNGTDALQEYCGTLQNIYNEDGATIKRRMREEWNREWDA